MKIVQISPNSLPIPPVDYGGTQRIIYYLTQELVRRGHEVILFAKKGSNTDATRTYEYPSDDMETHLDFIIKNIPEDTDIIHDHYGIVARANPPFPTIRSSHSKKVTDVQIPVYVSETILKRFGKNIGYFVHNGIKAEDYKFKKSKQDYLLFIGRIMEHKGVHLAIEVAKKTGKKLLIAGTFNNNEKYEHYFNTVIKPQLNEQIKYIGAIGGNEKLKLLSNASCVLFPSTWSEPFGLVLIEALASGTPVLAFRRGGVQEVLKDLPIMLCNSTEEMAAKVLDRTGFPTAKECRNYVRNNFSDEMMADRFLGLYEKIIANNEYKVVKKSEWNKRKATISVFKPKPKPKSKSKSKSKQKLKLELKQEPKVSIITCTMRPAYIDNVLNNYNQQNWANKELIVILNNDQMDLNEWNARAKQLQNVRIYKLSEENTLGKCLNWAITKAKGTIIAKFDDDDYYAPDYLNESVHALINEKASIVGKCSSYIYFEEMKALMLYRSGRENKPMKRIKGGTLLFHKSVWKKIKFPEDRVSGSDSHWLKHCRVSGISIYSVSKDHYVCVRRTDTQSHTQKKETSRYMSSCELIGYTDNFISYINKEAAVLE